MSSRNRQRLSWRSWGVAVSFGVLAALSPLHPAQSAERVKLAYGLLQLSVSVDSLETLAKEGRVDSEFAYYARLLGPQRLLQLRTALQQRVNLSPVLIDRGAYTQLGEALLKRLGLLIQPTPGVNGETAIRSALILAAADPEGLTPVNVLRRFPTPELRLNAELALQLWKDYQALPTYRAQMVGAIAQQAEAEAKSEAASAAVQPSQLPDLGQPGPDRFIKQTLTLTISATRQTVQGLVTQYQMPVDLYLPQGLTQAAPVVIMSHGFGSTRETYSYVAEHLASYGFVVVAPEHIGSNLPYRQQYFKGGLRVDISPLEFVSRPLEISAVIDELERRVRADPAFAKQINLQQIGIFGNSFGASTALTAAGATINQARLAQECTPDRHLLNFSVLLQCRAASLPPQNYQLGDRRIKAVFVAYPLTSVLFGPEGLSRIQIPILMMAGSRDVFTPVFEEQVHPYLWLNTPNKYLALMINGTHFSTATDEINARLPEILRSPAPNLGRKYMYALTVAFFNRYLADRAAYQPYLTSTYAEAYGQEPLKLKLVRSLSPEQLNAAYGGKPPAPLIPAPVPTIALPQRPE